MTSATYEAVLYRVQARIEPWTSQSTRFIGFYPHEQTANAVADFVREIFISAFKGGIDVGVDPLRASVIHTPAGRRLKENPHSPVLYSISEELDRKEYEHLLGVRFTYGDEDPRLTANHTDGKNATPYVSEEDYFCLSGKSEDCQSTRVLGYYKSAEVAQRALFFFHKTHTQGVFSGTLGLYGMRGNVLHLSSENQLHIDPSGATHKIVDGLDRTEYLRLLDFS